MRKKLLALLLAVVLSTGLLPAAFAANDGSNEFNISITGTQAYAYAYKVAEQVNQLRADLGLSQLTIDPVLMETAMLRAAECAVHYSSSHTRPNGTRCFTAFPNRGRTYMAENIAAGYTSPDAVMNGWTNSSGHYANMTSTSVNAIGVGCFYANGTYYWAQCFTGGSYESSSERLSDRTAAATMPVTGDYISLTGGTGTVSLRVGESCQLTVYNRNPGFYSDTATVVGIDRAVLSAGTDLVKLDSDTLTVTGVAAGSGTITLSLPNGTALSFPVQVAERFTDVTRVDYFYDAVAWAVENQVTDGTSKNQFSPRKDCTEVEILTFLYRAAGEPEAAASPFTMASWCQDAVNWAYEKKMIDSDFVPGTPCTRARAVMFIWQAAGEEDAPASSFSDVTADAGCAKAVNWAMDNGVTDGTGNNQFSPDRTCKREEIITLLWRAKDHLTA